MDTISPQFFLDVGNLNEYYCIVLYCDTHHENLSCWVTAREKGNLFSLFLCRCENRSSSFSRYDTSRYIRACHPFLLYLRISFEGVSTAAAHRPFSERGVQLSTTDNFCRKNGKCCTIKYCISFLRILDFF